MGQSASIKGAVTDSINKKDLQNTVVSLLQAKDSILYKFTRTNNKGAFELKNLKAGDYVLLVSYPEYADYVDKLTLDSTSSIDLKTLFLTSRANLLKEVIVKSQVSAIKIKGDTTEYTADSFKVEANASVEDLLKKLPGIQVDKNGQITAQGEKVPKVLVDGEEFFGDDPTLVTQNLRADMVDKVQVFDKKSDQANFTGIDDGERTKTINLKLKDNKKNGYFGKINANQGTEGYHDYQAMINMFKNKQKFAAYGIVSNTGTSGLNWQDRDSYGQSFASSVEYDETNGWFMFNGSGDDELDSWDGRYNGRGYPSVKTGGMHYNNKWNEDKQSVNANYKFMNLDVNGQTDIKSQYILPDSTSQYNNQQQFFTNEAMRHAANGNYEIQIDSSSSIKVIADGGLTNKKTNSRYLSQMYDKDSAMINNSIRDISNESDARTFNSNILWRKKLKKKGRTLSLNLSEQYSMTTSDGYLKAQNDFYKTGSITETQLTDQYKNSKSENLSFDTKLTYSEPLSKVSSLVFNYGIVVNNSSSERNSFNKASDGKYTQLDSLFSNDYKFDVFTHRTGLSYSFFEKKIKFNLGSNVGFTDFKQTDVHADSSITRNFVNWFPNANFNYQFTQYRRLSLRYNGSTQQPSIQQIQPVRSNEDPLNISIGNPDLKPAFRNNIWMSFNDFKVLSERGIWTSLSYNFTQNAISSRDYVDSLGRRVYQSVNLDGNSSWNGYLDYNFKIKKINTRLGFNGNFNSSKYSSIVNDALNVTRSNTYRMGIWISNEKEKKYSFNINAGAAYTNSKSSVQKNLETKYWTFDVNPNLDIYLPLKFQVHTDANMNFRQKTSVFDNNTNVVLLNAWVGKKFLKKDALLVKVSGQDILNRNLGVDRSQSSNFISQTTYTTIRRYFLLSAVWNFTKAGGAGAPSNGN